MDTAEQTATSGASHELLASLCARQFAEYLAKAHKNEDDAARGDDPDAIHDLRVAIRRIRTALQVLEDAPGADAKRLRALRKDLRPLAHALGEARDLDLMLANLDAFAEDHGGADASLTAMRSLLAERRADRQHNVRRILGKRKTQHALAGIKHLSEHDATAAQDDDPSLVAVRAFAGGAIWRRYGPVLAFERKFPTPSLDQWHRLRITCKQVRYTLEFFADALGPGVEPLITALTSAQDHLGALQDARSRNELLESLADKANATDRTTPGANGTKSHASSESGAHHSDHRSDYRSDHHADALTGLAAAYAQAQAGERDRLLAGAPDEWHAVAGVPFRRDLALLIAAL